MQGLCVDVVDLLFQSVFSELDHTDIKFPEYLELARDCLRDAVHLAATCKLFYKVYQKNNYHQKLHVKLNLRDPAQRRLFNTTCREYSQWCTCMLTYFQ